MVAPLLSECNLLSMWHLQDSNILARTLPRDPRIEPASNVKFLGSTYDVPLGNLHLRGSNWMSKEGEKSKYPPNTHIASHPCAARSYLISCLECGTYADGPPWRPTNSPCPACHCFHQLAGLPTRLSLPWRSCCYVTSDSPGSIGVQ